MAVRGVRLSLRPTLVLRVVLAHHKTKRRGRSGSRHGEGRQRWPQALRCQRQADDDAEAAVRREIKVQRATMLGNDARHD